MVTEAKKICIKVFLDEKIMPQQLETRINNTRVLLRVKLFTLRSYLNVEENLFTSVGDWIASVVPHSHEVLLDENDTVAALVPVVVESLVTVPSVDSL